MTTCRVAIVGTGPAGMAAAVATAKAGLRPVVIDENPLPGGQVYRQSPATFRSSGADQRIKTLSAKRGAALLKQFQVLRDKMTLLMGAAVWGIFPPRRLAVSGGDQPGIVDAEHLIIAQGAYEYVPPFPGWTLPGVMTPGGAQHLVKTMQVLPGRRAVVAGTGPFLLVVADQLARSGMKVAAVIEAASTSDALRALPGLLSHPALFRDGLGYLWRLRRAGVPIHRGHIVVEARGEEGLREVTVAACDERGYPDRCRAWTIEADTLCVGYGFVPRTQLAQLAGCRLRFAEHLGGWVPQVDESFQTSVPGVWVAGDGGGVGGALAAELQGSLAGLTVARQLRAVDSSTFNDQRQSLLRQLAKLARFRNALTRIAPLRPGFHALATEKTVVCRCEELTLGEIEAGIAAGGVNFRTLKVMTRLGMGPCQGRMCWPATACLIAARTERRVEEAGPLSIRPPVKAVRLEDLADLPQEALDVVQ
jgi:NADPH-dependent 2,4-dienoyl-CoA reductase/sulfur reductase-like enzyme